MGMTQVVVSVFFATAATAGVAAGNTFSASRLKQSRKRG
jgi:hypothetical protein